MTKVMDFIAIAGGAITVVVSKLSMFNEYVTLGVSIATFILLILKIYDWIRKARAKS